ncbi:MAG: hypothetical protein HS104_34625 [Polyangiaceae bacterium]|nr:hypothetical protein [Polyangiaceae bacterium]MCE7892976.1 hypothetical protein [Sorangiineae bacterium PRO1]MCL4756137.1 hypothetical protein [Myxococcales bacterium]
MLLSADASLSYPRPLVFATYRDHLVDLVEFLPNIRRIEVKTRKDEGKRTELLNEWHGGGEIPAAARAFLSESMLSWSDYASWNEDDWTCSWRIETHAFTEAVSCAGKNHFVESDGKTRLEIRGELVIDGAKLKGVPKLLSKRVASAVEDILVKKITPNLLSVSDGLRRYLEQKR